MKTAFERRSLVVIIVLLIVIFAVVGWNAQRLLSNFSSLEHRAVSTDAQRVQKAIQQELNDLGILVGDYAAWDDTYAYMQTHDEKYIANNFTAASLLNLKVDYVLFLDSTRNVVRGMRLRPEDSALVEIPSGDLAVILEHAAYLIPDNQFSARGGYLVLPNGPTAFSARAVVTTAQEGPLRGTLLMGRTLDDATLGSISDDLMFDLHIA
ncbi:hypothetical protein EG834_12195, partial [bacterium]|nr:hypothetical protein [bacterium]